MERYGIIHNGFCIEVVRGPNASEKAIKRRDEIEKALGFEYGTGGLIIKKELQDFPEVFAV